MFSRSVLASAAQITRRQALWAGALGSVGLSLSQLLRAETASPTRRAKSVIWIVPWGGPATLDTFDLKPHAPAEIRSPFRPIATRTPGFHVSEHLPRLASMSDRYAIVRSASHRISVHNAATSYTLTGTPPTITNQELTTANRSDAPSVGSILAKFRPARSGMPPYVQLPLALIDNGAFSGGQTAGFLGAAFDPLVVARDPNLTGFEVPSAQLRPDMTGPRLGQCRDIVQQLDTHAESWSQSAAAANMTTHYERAYDLLRSAAAGRAFDVALEPASVRDRYGRNTLGQSVLVARRLIEAGVRLVMVSDTLPNTNARWDTHDGNSYEKQFLPTALDFTDRAVSSLLADLDERGLLDETLVLWAGEFGRTPRRNQGGRDHWPHVYSLLLAGGGIRGGAVLGASDSTASAVRDHPVRPEDVLATVYAALGVPLETEIHDALGRPHRICAGEPMRHLL
jgi:Protein of unknown function (DUF1501)